MTSKGRTKQQLHVCDGLPSAILMWKAAPADKLRRRVMSEAAPALRCILPQAMALPTIARTVLKKAVALLHSADCRQRGHAILSTQQPGSLQYYDQV